MRIIGKTRHIGKRNLLNASVILENIREDGNQQRIDNFFFKRFKSVPKSHIYQLLRSGQVRVNGKRVSFHYRLQLGDLLRIPPIKMPAIKQTQPQVGLQFKPYSFDILYEDDAIMAINKPSGMAVHGGSGVSLGVIEQLRGQNTDCKFMELVHRLDRETSGVLLLAKKRSALVELHRQIRFGEMVKHYQVLVKGKWSNVKQHVKLPLIKYLTKAGERRVTVATGKQKPQQSNEYKAMAAHTVFHRIKAWPNFSLLDAELKTGRTHQIRVHLAHFGHPIVGDDKYGDFALNKQLAKKNTVFGCACLNRMFLHASSLQLMHPVSGQAITLNAPLPSELQLFLDDLEHKTAN